jgi:hypothetical protein
MTLTLIVFLSIAMLVALTMVSHAAEGRMPALRLGNIPSEGAASGGARETAAVVDDARLRGELAAGAAGIAAGRPVPDFRRRFQAVRAARPPVLNGKLDDPAWNNAQILTDFAAAQWFNDEKLPSPVADRTETMVLFDDAGLYIGVRAFQDPASIYTTIKANGWLRPDLDWETGSEEWADTGTDEIEIAIDPELTMASYYVFQVNPDGVRQKRYMPHVATEGGSVKRVDPVLVPDDRWRVATSRDERGWCAEIFIPYECIAFRPITTLAAKEVFFDMVQDRTVMGFNVNRISHRRREASSWSPSKGVMFFRDVENFGQAYFAPCPAVIAGVEFGGISGGKGRAKVSVCARGGKAAELALRVAVTGGGRDFEARQGVRLGAGETKTIALDFECAKAGRQRIDIRLVTPTGEVVDRVSYAFEMPAPVEVLATKSVLFEGEADFPVLVTVNAREGADEMRYRVKSRGKTIASAKAAPGGRKALLPFEVAGLRAGEYEFEAEARKAGKRVGVASQPFKVIADPWSMKVSGKAGRGVATKGVPAGFTALAATVEGDAEAEGLDGTIPYLTGQMKEKGYLWYGETATADFGAARRRRRGAPAVGAAAYPREAELARPIRAFAAGGEYEAVAFAIFALADLKKPRVEFSELRSAAGKMIAADQMDLRAERADHFVVRQETLGDIRKGTGRRYFLTIWVAPGIAAGVYNGTLKLSASGKLREERPYSLLVLPFALEASPPVNGVYGGMQGSADTGQDMVIAADLLAHGMDAPTCFGVFERRGQMQVHHIIWDLEKVEQENWLGDGAERFNVHIDEQVFRNLKRSGLRGPFVIEANLVLRYLPCTQENAEGFEALIRRIEALRKKHGLDEFTYHLVDEPNNHYTYDDGRYGRRYGIERVGYFGKVLHKIGVRCYETMNSAGRGYDIGQSVYGEVDIWCGNFISDVSQIERWTSNGKELWLYNYAGDGWCKGSMRSTYGFYARRVGAKGVTIWHYPGYVTWNEKERGVVGKSSWEAAREGIDDGRYVATLESAIGKARAAGGAKARLAAKAQKDLDSIVNAYPPLTRDKVEFEARHDADDWTKWRWIVAQWIVRLQDR